MLLVPFLALLAAAQTPASGPISGRSNVLTSWTSQGGQPVLLVHFAGTSRWIRGFGITPEDVVTLEKEDLNLDGQTDVTVRVEGPAGRFLHHIMVSEALPPLLDLAAGGVFQELVSDEDNFGFGAGAVPCAFFDNSEPEDVGIFDKVVTGSKVNTWTHDLSAITPDLNPLASVIVEIRETFSDIGAGAQVFIDGLGPFTLERSGLDCTGGCICAFGTVHTFAGIVLSAEFLADGEVVVSMVENGDDVGLDWSRLTIDLL
jgi:hypothetical protein